MVEIASGSRTPKETCLSSRSSGTVGWRSSGGDSCSSFSVTPTASTITNRSFEVAPGTTACRSVSEMTRTPRPFICSKYVAALDRAHEEDALERLDVGAGGDHVHGHRDPRARGVAEGGDQVVRPAAGRLVGDLRDEVVALAEDLAGDLDDLLGVRVVLGEDQRLRNLAAAGEDLGEEPVAEGLEHGPDLVAGDDLPVELGRGVGQLVVEQLPARAARLAVAEARPEARVDRRAVLGDLRCGCGRRRSRR